MPCFHLRSQLLALFFLCGVTVCPELLHAQPRCGVEIRDLSDLSSPGFRALLVSEDNWPEAYASLKRYLWPILMRLFDARERLSHEDAEDLAGEVFVGLVRNRARLATHPKPAAYVFAIAKNRLAEFRQKRDRNVQHYSRSDGADWEPIGRQYRAPQELTVLRRDFCLSLFENALFEGIKGSEQRAFTISVLFDHLSKQQQADLNRTTLASYFTLVSAAKRNLRTLLEENAECASLLSQDFEQVRRILAARASRLGPFAVEPP